MKDITDDVPEEHEFILRTGHRIRNLHELSGHLRIMDEDTLKHHVNEDRNDFHNWVKDVHKDEELAKKLKISKHRHEMISHIDSRIDSSKDKDAIKDEKKDLSKNNVQIKTIQDKNREQKEKVIKKQAPIKEKIRSKASKTRAKPIKKVPIDNKTSIKKEKKKDNKKIIKNRLISSKDNIKKMKNKTPIKKQAIKGKEKSMKKAKRQRPNKKITKKTKQEAISNDIFGIEETLDQKEPLSMRGVSLTLLIIVISLGTLNFLNNTQITGLAILDRSVNQGLNWVAVLAFMTLLIILSINVFTNLHLKNDKHK